MEVKKVLTTIAGVFMLVSICYGQQRVYHNYDAQDGLPSSTVYTVMQDRKGFMWFGTDRGMSRFDGTGFTNYTTADGLPDNDVFIITEDSIGRLWVICYNARPCYLHNGVIYNADNDTLLRNIDEGEMWLSNIYVDRQGKVWLLGDKIYVIDGRNVEVINTPDNKRCSGVGYVGSKLCVVMAGGVYYMQEKNGEIKYEKICTIDESFHHSAVYWDSEAYIAESAGSGSRRIIKITPDSVYIKRIDKLGIDNIIENFTTVLGDSLLLISQRGNSIKAFNKELKLMREPFPFLPPNLTYTHLVADNEGNIWTSTLERGVFFVSHIRSLKYLPISEAGGTEVSAVGVYGGKLLMGLDNKRYEILENDRPKLIRINNLAVAGEKMTEFCKFNDSTVATATDYGFYTISSGDFSHQVALPSVCVKSLWPEGKDSILLAGTPGLFRACVANKKMRFDTLSTSRTTSVAKSPNGTIWYSTLSGLYFIKDDHAEKYEYDSMLVRARITDITFDYTGRLWVATHKHGLFVVSENKLININGKNGLPSDLCIRLIYGSDSAIWVCANHNIARISIVCEAPFAYALHTLNGFNLGPGFRVNDLYVEGNDIFIASAQGMFRVSKDALELKSAPPVYITSFACNNTLSADYTSLKLAHHENNIEIKFVGVSYNNTAKILYKYIVGGTDGDTIFTYNTTIDFYALPPGKYFFSVWARNPQGVWSNEPASVRFEILPPIWKRWWFLGLSIFVVILLLWMAALWRINSIRKSEMEKTVLNKKIAEVELQAVRSHMNEHFIFNSLNSIQNFINKNDIEAANYYLANFGKLIRKTMEISSVPYISLKDEVEYLDNYLMLEKMRFGKKFDYTLTNHITELAGEDIILPSMVLQPYVENAIRHGLRHKTEGFGLLQIIFTLKEGLIICSIHDNGVGRKKTKELKSAMHIEYSSKGMRLSEDKVSLFNKLNNSKVSVEVEDLYDEQGYATGTLVSILIPINNIDD